MRLGGAPARAAAAILATLALGCGSSSSPDEEAGAAGGVGGGSGNASAGGGATAKGGATSQSGATATGGQGGSAGAGDGGGTPDAGAGALEPTPGSYGMRAELPAANSEMAVAQLGSQIYVLGGYPSTREVQTTVQVYDVAADAWELSVPLPIALHHPVVVGVGERLYSLGGQLADDVGNAGDEATDRTLALEPGAAEPMWIDLEPMPTARGAGAAAVIDDKIYVVGGRPPAGNAFEVYDISDDAWTPLEDLPQTEPDRNHLAAAAIGGKVYVAGGRHSGGSFSSPMTDSLDVFDPGTGMWTPAAPMLRPRGGVNGVTLFGCFFVWGGEGPDTGEPNDVFPDHDVYNPVTDAWTELPDLPTPIHGVTGAAAIDGLIYIPGGGTMQGGNSGSTIFQVYRPELSCE